MFPQTLGLGEFCFRGSYFYAELRGFALKYGIYEFVYVDRGKGISSIVEVYGCDIIEGVEKVCRDGRDNMSDINLI